MTQFEVTMQHSEKSFEALAHMQYDLFCKGNRVSRTILSFIFILVGVMNFSEWWGILVAAYGCYLNTSTYASANHTAHKLSAQIKEAGMDFPASRFLFREKAVEIIALPETGEKGDMLAYSDILRLGEDMYYYYIFRDQYGGYMIPKAELDDRVDGFRQFLEKKTGLTVRVKASPLVKLLRRVSGRKSASSRL